jgi:hypothetical protein
MTQSEETTAQQQLGAQPGRYIMGNMRFRIIETKWLHPYGDETLPRVPFTITGPVEVF